MRPNGQYGGRPTETATEDYYCRLGLYVNLHYDSSIRKQGIF